MNALLSPSSLLCERCHGHGFVKTAFGKVGCLECSGASPWILASQPPASEPGQHGGISIECVGLVRAGPYRGPEIVAYWPAVNRWTVTRKDKANEWFDDQIEVLFWMELPEFPLDESFADTRRGPDAETSEMFANIHRNREQFSVEAVNKALSEALANKKQGGNQ